jgi:hypothetical protein
VTGEKLLRTTLDGEGATETKRYASGSTYRDADGTGAGLEALDHLSHAGGRVRYYKSGDQLAYQYAFSDHLGNTRVLAEPDGRQAAVANASWLFNYLEPITQNGRQVGNVEVMGTLWFDEATVENQLNSYPAKWKESSPRVSNYLSDLKQRPRSEWIPVLIAERIEMADGGRATGIARNGVIALDRQGFTEATFHQEVLNLAFGASEFEAYSGDLAAGVRPWSDVRDRLSDPKGSIWRGSESYADQLGSSVDGNVVVNEEQLRQRMTTIVNAIIGKDE